MNAHYYLAAVGSGNEGLRNALYTLESAGYIVTDASG